MMTLPRTRLRGAPYNPRQIDDNAKKKLKENIKKVGLIQPIIWNKRTGNIVAGHQRIAILDALSRNNPNYNLDVAVVDLDEKTEKEQVVFLNNELAMGSFDLPKLDVLLKEVDFSNCGFDKLDLQVMLPSFELPAGEAAQEQLEDVSRVVDDIEEAIKTTRSGEAVRDAAAFDAAAQKKRAARAQSAEAHPENEDVEFFLVLVFKNRSKSEQFLDLVHVDRSEKYISGEMITGLIQKAEGNVEEA